MQSTGNVTEIINPPMTSSKGQAPTQRVVTGNAHPEPVQRLINELAKLPGVGQRSAERMAFHLLKTSQEDAMCLSDAIKDVKTLVQHCRICSNLTDQQICHICSSPNRDASSVLVVEQPKDMISFEQTGTYKGVYHILMGRLDPLGGIGPDSLTIKSLMSRIDDPVNNCRSIPVREVILGLNPNMEGDSTALYLADQLANSDVYVTRLARGLPAGSQLEYANSAVLADAIQGRLPMRPHK